MKKIVTMLAVSFLASGCLTTTTPPTTAPTFDLCLEKQKVADGIKMSIKEIGDLAMPLSEKDVRFLIRPLSKNYNLDEAQCQGYTEQVRNASRSVVSKHGIENIPTLHQICSSTPESEIHEVSLLAAMEEERRGAKEALIMLHVSTNECLAN
jgi:hypothetical protein